MMTHHPTSITGLSLLVNPDRSISRHQLETIEKKAIQNNAASEIQSEEFQEQLANNIKIFSKEYNINLDGDTMSTHSSQKLTSKPPSMYRISEGDIGDEKGPTYGESIADAADATAGVDATAGADDDASSISSNGRERVNDVDTRSVANTYNRQQHRAPSTNANLMRSSDDANYINTSLSNFNKTKDSIDYGLSKFNNNSSHSNQYDTNSDPINETVRQDWRVSKLTENSYLFNMLRDDGTPMGNIVETNDNSSDEIGRAHV